jgi:uncharacterized protein
MVARRELTNVLSFSERRRHVMNTSTSVKRSPLTFFILVFALALPFWVLGALAKPLPPPINVSLSSFQGVGPLIAALILVYREEKLGGIKRLLKRVFDVKRIRQKIWYVPMIFLLPGIYLLSYGVMLLLGRPLPRVAQRDSIVEQEEKKLTERSFRELVC